MPDSTLTNSRIVAAYREKTARSAALAAEAHEIYPSGLTHDSRHLDPYCLYVDHAQGARKWDVDGNEYVDFFGGHGALLLGHSHPDITRAVHAQIDKGTHYGSGHELEVRWGQLVKTLIPCAERVRFTASGTEANLMAFRLARAFTGKYKIVRFHGHFHGWQDHVAFGVTDHFDGTASTGVVPGIADEILLAPADDIDETRRIIESHDDIAAVILEPTGSGFGQVPVTKEFVAELRRITEKHDILLIFDEVVAGFRAAKGGAQDYFGEDPLRRAAGRCGVRPARYPRPARLRGHGRERAGEDQSPGHLQRKPAVGRGRRRDAGGGGQDRHHRAGHRAGG